MLILKHFLTTAMLILAGQGYGLRAAPATADMRDIAFQSSWDGTTQKYVLLPPPRFQADTPCDVLIALHGHGADRWQFAKDRRDECRATRDVARAHAMLLVSPDYRAPTSWMGPKAEADVVQIIAELKQKYQVSRVFLCGGSMGGTACLTFAALHPDLVAGVAAMNGTANLLEYDAFQPALLAIQTSFGGTAAAIPREYKRRSAEYWPERLTMPIGMTASGQDQIVPPQSVLRLAKVLKRIGRDVLVIEREDQGHLTHYADAQAILEFVLQKAKPPIDQTDRSKRR